MRLFKSHIDAYYIHQKILRDLRFLCELNGAPFKPRTVQFLIKIDFNWLAKYIKILEILMKHDAHVRTAFIHFFPTTTFFFLIFVSFGLGLILGNIWGFESCYNFKSLLYWFRIM